MAEIQGNLMVYIDGKPLGVTTSANIDISQSNDYATVLAPAVSDFTMTVSGKWPMWSRLDSLKFEWYCSRRMPRKQKKAYRKKLRDAIVHEMHREQVDKFLSTIGPN